MISFSLAEAEEGYSVLALAASIILPKKNCIHEKFAVIKPVCTEVWIIRDIDHSSIANSIDHNYGGITASSYPCLPAGRLLLQEKDGTSIQQLTFCSTTSTLMQFQSTKNY